jgi:hypothetical protein
MCSAGPSPALSLYAILAARSLATAFSTFVCNQIWACENGAILSLPAGGGAKRRTRLPRYVEDTVDSKPAHAKPAYAAPGCLSSKIFS